MNKEKCPLPDSPIVSMVFDYTGGVLIVEEHDVRVTIPHGAIEVGQKIQIEVSADLFGNFVVPESYQPISAYVWIGACYKFKKQLEIEVEHWAVVSQQDLSHLCILTTDCEMLCAKSEMNLEEMYEDTCNHQYEINGTTCTFYTDHFCSKCLATKYRELPKRIVMYHYVPKDYTKDLDFVAEVCFCYDLRLCKKVSM